MPNKEDELRHALKCAEVSLEGKRDRIALLERVLTDWLDAYDTPEHWMRCRNNAKLALGRDADQLAPVLLKDVSWVKDMGHLGA